MMIVQSVIRLLFFVVFVIVGVTQNFKDFEDLGFAEAFVFSPAHCGKGFAQGGVASEFDTEGVVTHVEHGGEFLCGVEHS